MATTGALHVEKARVVGVHPREYSVDVVTDASRGASDPLNLPIGYPYTHPQHSGGLHFLPQEDSFCYVAFPPNGSPFILAFTNDTEIVDTDDGDTGAHTVKSFAAHKEPLEPGDIRMATQDGNHVTVRRGGIVQIASTALSQIMLLPVDNLLRFYFQKFQMFSPLGEVDWGHAHFDSVVHDKDPSQQTAVLVKYSIKEYAQEDVKKDRFTVELRVGRLATNSNGGTLDSDKDGDHEFGVATNWKGTKPLDGVLSLVVYDHSQAVPPVSFSFQLNKHGHGALYFAEEARLACKRLSVDAVENITLSSVDGSVVDIAKNIKMTSGATVAIKGGNVVVEGTTALTLTCGPTSITITPGGIMLGGNVTFAGASATKIMAARAALKAAMSGPQHVVTGTIPEPGVVAGFATMSPAFAKALAELIDATTP